MEREEGREKEETSDGLAGKLILFSHGVQSFLCILYELTENTKEWYKVIQISIYIRLFGGLVYRIFSFEHVISMKTLSVYT